MNKIKTLVFMSLLLFAVGQMRAQTHGAILAGASFPMGHFADYDNVSDFALTSKSAYDGGAAIGFNVGFKWCFGVGVKGLGVMLSVDGFYNGPNSDLKTAYRNGEGIFESDHGLINVSREYTSTPRYINVPAMLGLNYSYPINPQLSVFVEAGAGGNLRFITEMETLLKGNNVSMGETRITTTRSFDRAFGFAYQAGAGLEIAKNLVIGCSFYDLGKADVKLEEITKKTTVNDNAMTQSDPKYPVNGSLHPMMVLTRIGFMF